MKNEGKNKNRNRYLFQCNRDVPVAGKLRKKYPDSTVTDKSVDLSPGSYKAVICLTKNISHIAYNAMRAQCKTKGIPFLHVSSTNLSVIESQISQYF